MLLTTGSGIPSTETLLLQNNRLRAEAQYTGSVTSSSEVASSEMASSSSAVSSQADVSSEAVSSEASSSEENNNGSSANKKSEPKSPVAETKQQIKEAAKEDPQKKKEQSRPAVSVPDTMSTTPEPSMDPGLPSIDPSEIPSLPDPSSELPSSAAPGWYPDGWNTIDGRTYFYQNGMPLTGWQSANGFRYYFDGSGALQSKVGIDVSKYQGSIDWSKVRAAGVDFAIIRVGYRGYGTGVLVLDEWFFTNIRNAKAAGLKVGVYFYTQAISEAEAVEEAQFAINKVRESGVALDYPIAYDIERVEADGARTANLTNAQRTAFCQAFANTVVGNGYKSLIYSNKNWLENYINTSQLPHDIWLAHYTSGITSYAKPYKMWQYSKTGRINGISGDVDLNIGFY